MTTEHHTPYPFGGPLTSTAMNAPLGQLDAAVVAVEGDIEQLVASMGSGAGWSSTLDAEAASGQKVVPVASTAGAVAGMPIYIGTTAGTHEVGVIDTISAGVSVTLLANLANTYATATPISATPAEVADARSGYATLGAHLDALVPASGPDEIEINGGFTNSFDTSLWIAAAARTNPTVASQSLYAQHRVTGNAGAGVHDAVSAEIRLSGITSTAFLNAMSAGVRVTGGANAIVDTRAITANLSFEGAPTGTITAARLIVSQTISAPPAGMSIGTVYGLAIEAQTVGTVDNWSIYAPTGKSRLGVVSTDGDVTVGQGTAAARTVSINPAAGQVAAINLQSGGLNRWVFRKESAAESGANAGADFGVHARNDAGDELGTVLTLIRATRGVMLGTGPVGFYGTTPGAKPTITGSRGSNAALASLLTSLATLGLVTDSSSA